LRGAAISLQTSNAETTTATTKPATTTNQYAQGPLFADVVVNGADDDDDDDDDNRSVLSRCTERMTHVSDVALSALRYRKLPFTPFEVSTDDDATRGAERGDNKRKDELSAFATSKQTADTTLTAAAAARGAGEVNANAVARNDANDGSSTDDDVDMRTAIDASPNAPKPSYLCINYLLSPSQLFFIFFFQFIRSTKAFDLDARIRLAQYQPLARVGNQNRSVNFSFRLCFIFASNSFKATNVNSNNCWSIITDESTTTTS
jgi:hypothetical protein